MTESNSTVRRRNVEEFLEGFAGYRVGDDGSVWCRWSRYRHGRRLGDRWYPMKQSPSGRGYPRVNLVPPEGGSYRTFAVHHLVLLAFVGPCPDGMECRHLDGNKADPSLYDAEGKFRLVWGTPEENRKDNRDLNAYQVGEGHSQAKLTEADVRSIRERYAAGGVLMRELAEEHHTTLPNIHAIVHRRSWKHVV